MIRPPIPEKPGILTLETRMYFTELLIGTLSEMFRLRCF